VNAVATAPQSDLQTNVLKVYVPPVAAAGRLYSESLRRVVGDIIRQPHDGAATQFETIVVRELLRSDSPLTPAQMWGEMRRSSPPGPALFATLAEPIERLVLRLQLDDLVARITPENVHTDWQALNSAAPLPTFASTGSASTLCIHAWRAIF